MSASAPARRMIFEVAGHNQGGWTVKRCEESPDGRVKTRYFGRWADQRLAEDAMLQMEAGRAWQERAAELGIIVDLDSHGHLHALHAGTAVKLQAVRSQGGVLVEVVGDDEKQVLWSALFRHGSPLTLPDLCPRCCKAAIRAGKAQVGAVCQGCRGIR